MFDLNGDGETDASELFLCEQMFNACTDEDEDEDDDDELDVSSGYDWRDMCVPDFDNNTDPYDYETEEEYEEAVEEAKNATHDIAGDSWNYNHSSDSIDTDESLNEAEYVWRDTCEDGSEYSAFSTDYDTEDDYNEALENAKYAWRDTCEDGYDYDVYPEDYETEQEYNDALDEAKYAWRDTCEDGSEYGLIPEDFETEEEYNEALEELQEDENSINICLKISDKAAKQNSKPSKSKNKQGKKKSTYVNKRRYDAEHTLKDDDSWYINDDERIKDRSRCRFIIEKSDTILAANYLSHKSGFLYAQAIKDNFKIPVSLPNEDEKREYEFIETIKKIAKKDIPLSLEVWNWCLEQFLPYIKYEKYYDSAYSYMTYRLIESIYEFPDNFKTELVRYMDKHSDFCQKIIDTKNQSARNIEALIIEAMNCKLWKLADKIFTYELKKANGKWRLINNLTDSIINCGTCEDELEPIEYFQQNLFPMIKAINDGMVQDEVEEWEEKMTEFIDRVESRNPKYAYCRRNAWRKTAPSGEEYHLNPVNFNSEQEYLNAINFKKYGWRLYFKEKDTCGINPEDYETADLFRKAIFAKEKEERNKKQYNKCMNDPKMREDKEIYTYCGVVFPFADTVYNFRTDDQTIKIGDTVIVPAGQNKEGQKAKVVSVGQYMRINAPYPVEKAKFIIRKDTDENT